MSFFIVYSRMDQSGYVYNKKLIEAAYLRFQLPSAGRAIHVCLLSEPVLGKACRVRIEQPGKAPRMLNLSEIRDPLDSPEAIALAVCKCLNLPQVAPENVRLNTLEPALPPLLRISGVSPCYTDSPEYNVQTIEAVVAFADLRDFSSWTQGATPQQITSLFDIISDSVSLILSEYQFDYWKLLGDGVLLIWRVDQDAERSAQQAFAGIQQLIRAYAHYHENTPGTPSGFGAAVCMGPVIEFSSSKFFDSCLVRDFLGPVVNLASRLQGLAEAEVILLDHQMQNALSGSRIDSQDVSEELKDSIAQLKGVDPNTRIYRVEQKD